MTIQGNSTDMLNVEIDPYDFFMDTLRQADDNDTTDGHQSVQPESTSNSASTSISPKHVESISIDNNNIIDQNYEYMSILQDNQSKKDYLYHEPLIKDIDIDTVKNAELHSYDVDEIMKKDEVTSKNTNHHFVDNEHTSDVLNTFDSSKLISKLDTTNTTEIIEKETSSIKEKSEAEAEVEAEFDMDQSILELLHRVEELQQKSVEKKNVLEGLQARKRKLFVIERDSKKRSIVLESKIHQVSSELHETKRQLFVGDLQKIEKIEYQEKMQGSINSLVRLADFDIEIALVAKKMEEKKMQRGVHDKKMREMYDNLPSVDELRQLEHNMTTLKSVIEKKRYSTLIQSKERQLSALVQALATQETKMTGIKNEIKRIEANCHASRENITKHEEIFQKRTFELQDYRKKLIEQNHKFSQRIDELRRKLRPRV